LVYANPVFGAVWLWATSWWKQSIELLKKQKLTINIVNTDIYFTHIPPFGVFLTKITIRHPVSPDWMVNGGI
jgi:hypothetical protein